MADEVEVKSPSVERLTWLRDELKPWLTQHFKENGEDQSVLFAVAQYWADEADDAVHLTALASKSRVPDFFASEWNEEDRTSDTRGVDWSNRPSWDDNGMSIRAFQAYCGELGSQELPSSAQAEPFLLAQRGEKGPQVTWLGRMQRPWLDLPHTGLPGFLGEDDAGDGDFDREPLDLVLPAQKLEPVDLKSLEAIASDPFAEGPRRVWADVWMSRNDPRGVFMQQRHPALEQFVEHGEFWLGALNQVVPFGSAVFEYGSLAEADVAFDESRVHLAESPWWLSVHTLRFSGPLQVFSKQMRGLRHVRGLDAQGLLALAGFAGTNQLLSLQATLGLSELEVLRELPLQALRSLSLTVTGDDPLSRLKLPAAWKHLEHVRISRPWQWADEDGEVAGDGDEMPSVQELRAALPAVARVSVSAADSSNLPSGWDLTLQRDDVATLRLERLGPTARGALLERMLEGLPSAVKTVVLEPSVIWAPTTGFSVGPGRKAVLGTPRPNGCWVSRASPSRSSRHSGWPRRGSPTGPSTRSKNAGPRRRRRSCR